MKKLCLALVLFLMLQTDTTHARFILNSAVCEGSNIVTKNIVLSFVGDCTLGTDDKQGQWGTFNEMAKNVDYGYFFENVLPIFAEDDMTIINLEGPLTVSTEKQPNKDYAFKGLPEFTEILVKGSVEMANIANNHNYDFMESGFAETKQNLKNAGINYYGMDTKTIIKISGVKFGFIGYKNVHDTEAQRKAIKNDIKYLKDNGAVVCIATFHWGEERANYPNDIQMNIGRYAVDAGADLVIGHHSHVIQSIEIYKNIPIIYSLGNFCFGGNKNPSDKDTFIYQHTFSFINNKRSIETDTIKIIPARISSSDTHNDYKPTPATNEQAVKILERLLTYSKDFGSLEFIQKGFVIWK